MRKFYRCFAGVLSLFIMSLLGATLLLQSALPDSFCVAEGNEFQLVPQISFTGISVNSVNKSVITDSPAKQYNVDFRLFRSVAVKQVQVQVINRKMVVPGGCPFGIKLHTKGVIVVGMSDVQNGVQNINPAKDAGLKVGDVITAINGAEISRNDEVKSIVSKSCGEQVKINAVRDGTSMTFYLNPVKSEYDGGFKAGMWVRDSSAGIGTMTYYDPETLGFGGLGHAVCDIDTGGIMPMFSGEIVDVNISGVHIGQSGKPGELKGAFVGNVPLGNLRINSTAGIFGILNCPVINAAPIPMALKQEIQPGPAKILATVSGNKPQSFDIEIEKVNYSDTTPTKNMVIRVVDSNLLAVSGGIVQGMSGSPIIQNGMLVGAVTHVFVNDPTRGYGIFAENMEKVLNAVESGQIAA